MSFLEDIKIQVGDYLVTYDTIFKSSLESSYPFIEKVSDHLMQNRGKQIRPLLVFICASMIGKLNRHTVEAAVALELLHNATLLHDDVVDATYERRGKQALNAVLGNKIAVLSGDFVLSRSLSLSISIGDFRIMNVIAELGAALAQGEILQLEKSKSLDIDMDVYFDVIDKKTAILFSSCAQAAAITVGATDNDIEKIKEIGLLIGRAFQIKDDIFDFSPALAQLIGKPVGNDVKEKKITLPLLLAFKNSNATEVEAIKLLLKKDVLSEKDISAIIAFADSNNGIEDSLDIMSSILDKAVTITNTFGNSLAKTQLLGLIAFLKDRKS